MKEIIDIYRGSPKKPTINEICNKLYITNFYDLYINKKNIVENN